MSLPVSGDIFLNNIQNEFNVSDLVSAGQAYEVHDAEGTWMSDFYGAENIQWVPLDVMNDWTIVRHGSKDSVNSELILDAMDGGTYQAGYAYTGSVSDQALNIKFDARVFTLVGNTTAFNLKYGRSWSGGEEAMTGIIMAEPLTDVFTTYELSISAVGGDDGIYLEALPGSGAEGIIVFKNIFYRTA